MDKDNENSHRFPAEELTEVFCCWNKLFELMKDYHLDIAAVETGLNRFNDTLMAHFWRVQIIQDKAVNRGFILQKGGQTPSN